MKKRFKGKRKPSGPVPVSDRHDRLVLRLPCYEPAGQSIELTEGDLLRHMLLIGQTGAGKSSTLNGILADLIAHRADDVDHRSGMVIMDNQADDTIAKIRYLAAKVGRQDDILHLSGEQGWYCPLGTLKNWSDLDRATGRLISASRFVGDATDNNSFWTETTEILAQTCLVIMLVTSREVCFSDLLHFASYWLVGGRDLPVSVTNRLKLFQSVAESVAPSLTPAVQAKMSFASATVHMWETLDHRTRNILRSSIAGVLRPFLSLAGLRYWDHSLGPRIDPSSALDGKIVVISVPSAVEPELATILGRLTKMDFYEGVQRRTYRPGDRIVAMVQDEYPYSVTVGSSRWSDVTNLATLRARGACLIAATQGLANLELVVGERALNALLLNFSNLLFFRSQEPLVGLWAERLFGFKDTPDSGPKQPPKNAAWSNTLQDEIPSVPPQTPELVCPRGSGLAGLQSHQAFISTASGWRTQEPVWLAPQFIDTGMAASTPAEPDRDMEIITKIRKQLSPTDELNDPVF